jgi:hypothetical protein
MESDPGTDGESQYVDEPAKVLRVATMAAALLEELRSCSPDQAGRQRLLGIYETAVSEVGAAVSQDLRDELDRVRPPIGDGPVTQSEMRVAQAQLVGWLEGLVVSMQAAMAIPPPDGPPGAPGPQPSDPSYL